MRENWKEVPLKEACELFTDGDWIETKNQSPKGIRLIQTGNIGSGKFKNRKKKARYISKETFKELNCTEVLPGDLLVSRLPDPVGRSCIIPDIGSEMITAVDCTIIRPKSNLLYPEYLMYYQMSSGYYSEVNKKVTGTTRSRISRKNLGKLNIPVPPLPEQKHMVEILDEAFEAIGQAKTNIERNIKNAEELFQSKLEDVFNKEIQGWNKKKLEDVCEEIFAGGDTPKENFSKDISEEFKIPVIGNAVKNRGLHGFTDEARVTKPSITIAARGSGTGHTEVRKEPYLPVVRLIVLVPNKNQVRLSFLKYVIDNLEILRSGTAIPQLTVPMIKSYSFHIPELEVQKVIEEDLNILRQEIEEIREIYRKRLDSLNELKKSILQKAFSGELTANEQVAA